MKQLPGAIGVITGILEGLLQWPVLGVIIKVNLTVITTGSRSQSSGEHGCSRRSTINSRRVGVSEGESSLCQTIQIWSNRLRIPQRPRPVVHVVHRNEQYVRPLGAEVQYSEQEGE